MTSIPLSEDIYLTWDEIHRMCRDVTEKIYDRGLDEKNIVAIARGGLVPAAIISNILRNTNVYSILVTTRHGDQKIFDIKSLKRFSKDEDIVFIDEIVDSGRTYNILKESFPKSNFVSLIIKRKELANDVIYSRDLSDHEGWVIFPWE